ncbi:MAG: M12 family metallo-peptidase [Prevotellaceae bacterium]|jgi:gliding motility-associated-like protein|nr:M12 family metallo-peptidase [Prevotellaceae bacterium]
MKNFEKYMPHRFMVKSFLIFICIILTAKFSIAQNQRIININNESSFQNLVKQQNHLSLKNMFPKEVENFRPFEHNLQLKNLTSKNHGDILLLDFFDNKKYKAIVQKVTVDYDGIKGITAKILDTDFGYCYISISKKGISISADIPLLNEQFFVAKKNGKSYLTHCKMSEMKKNELDCDDIDLHELENSEHTDTSGHANITHYEDIAFDAGSCTFPPDNISDSVTVNVMIVYTENAEQYADDYFTDIDNVIDQAMQRANVAMENSLTNITFTLAYKHKVNYTEVNNNNDLYNLTNTADGYMDEVHDLRKQYKADLVMLIPKVGFTGGLAWLLDAYIPGNGRPAYGFGLSRVQQTSWTYTMVHEMGHNMGCGHHWQQNSGPGPGLFSYSSGYRGQDENLNWYSTIMTYENGIYYTDGNEAPRIAFFSDPDIIHSGVNIGDAVYANNALTLRQSKHAVSRYSDYFVPGLKCLSVSEGTLSPVFHTDTANYTVTVPSSVSSVTVYAMPSHPSSTILAGGTGTHSLLCNSNHITVTVQTPDNSTKSYTLTVIRTCEATVSPSDTAICVGGSATLRAGGNAGAIFKWYDSQTGGTLLHTGNIYTVSPAYTTDYYVSQTDSGIESTRAKATVTVIPLPNAPTANDINTCYDGNTHTAGATAETDESVVWYALASGGTVTAAPSRNTAGTTTAYAAAKNNITGCESATRTAVSVTINPEYNINIYDTVCTSESYMFNGNTYTATGIYTDSLISCFGCDSIITLDLTVLQSCNQQNINTDNDYYELVYGAIPFNFTATASSGLPLTFTTTGTSVDIRNISAGQYLATVQETGTTVVTFQQAGDSYFAPAELSVTIKINPAELTIKAEDYIIYAGDALPVFGYKCSGFVYGEDSTVLTKFPVISCSAVNTNVAGEYPVTVNGAEADNYTIKYISGRLKIKNRKEPLPNVFTPYNQDNINDIFGENYDLHIFNRLGICLFKGNNGWDGKYKGKMVPPGVYYYCAKDSNGYEYKGSIILIKNN